jgi:hypothetical protein
MLINLEFDNSALGAPQSFIDTIQTAAKLIDTTFTDPITVNLSVGYGELTAGSTVYALTNGAAESVATGGQYVSFSQARSLLAGQVSSDVLSGVQALPDAAAVQGQSNVIVWSAEEKALGLVPASAPGLDGATGFATDIPVNLLEGVALHELTHAMGRVTASGGQADVFDLYRYVSPGVHAFGQTSTASYFSLDGGITPLAGYGQNSDPSDFLNGSGLTPNDAFNEYYGPGTLQQLSHVDLLQMEALGFHAATQSTAPDPVVYTAASSYSAPAGVTTIHLTGSSQSVTANNAGDTIWSNDTGNVLIGGSGNDVFHLGRGGDWVAGGAGADTFVYSATPWTGGGITDFNPAEGDRIDVGDLLKMSGYSGADPFADGYLKLTADASGNAQLWSNLELPGNSGWWLVATLDGVSTSSLHYSGGLIT